MGRQIYAERQRHTRREDLPETDESVVPEGIAEERRQRYGEIGEKLLDLIDLVDLALYDQEYGAAPDPDEIEPDGELEPTIA